MRPVADCLQRRFRSAGETHDLRILQLGMIAHQPENRIRTILPPRQWRVARAALAAWLRQADLRYRKLQMVLFIRFRRRDFLAGQLARRNRIMSPDPGGDFTVRDTLYLKRMKLAKIGDLLEGERCILDEPNRGGLGH